MAGTVSGGIIAIVPAYNEEETIGRVVGEMAGRAPFLHIVVVDDGSTDSTAAAASQAGALVLSHPVNLGIGEALKTGMAYTLRRGYRYAVRVDGDGQHDPSEIHRLLGPLFRGECDAVIGSRFMGTGDYRQSRPRRAGSLLISAAVGIVTGRKVTDPTSGFWAVNHRALKFLLFNCPGDFPESEALVLMHMGGITWKEIPVAMRGRAGGKSSIGGLCSIFYMVKVLMAIALEGLRIKVPVQAV